MNTQTNRKPMASEQDGDRRNDGACARLMRSLGSATGRFTAHPPSQTDSDFRDGETPLIRLRALITQESLGRIPPSPWAVDDDGHAHTTRSLADKLKCTEKHIANTLAEALACGLFRRATAADGKRLAGAIGVNADKVKSRRREDRSPVQGGFVFSSPEVLAQIHNFDPPRRVAAEEWAVSFNRWSQDVLNAATDKARKIIAEERYSALRAIGVKLPPKQMEVISNDRGVQLELTLEPPAIPDVLVSPVKGKTMAAGQGNGSPLVQAGFPSVQVRHIRNKNKEEATPVSGAIFDVKKEESSPVPCETTGPDSLLMERTEALRELLLRWLGAKLSPDIPGPIALHGILAALGDADFALLTQRIQARMSSITSYGMVINLARDAAKLARC